MAGTYVDFKIYPEQFWGGMSEELSQMTDAFNAASNGAIVQTTIERRGHYVYESFISQMADGAVSYRDIGAITPAAVVEPTHSENISVKLNRKIGPIRQTLDAYKKAQMNAGITDMELLSFHLGGQIAKGVAVDYLNSMLLAGRVALAAQADVFLNATGSTLSETILNNGLSLFGDNSQNILCWVMTGKSYHNLVGSQITSNYQDLTGAVLQGQSPATLGRVAVVSDSTSLAGAVNTNYVLGLTANGLVAEESEDRTIHSDMITLNENLQLVLQGEYAYNARVKGFAWDVANGGLNPDNTALGTATNWDPATNDFKHFAGICIQVDD